MQINTDTLRQFAETTVEKYTRANFDIMAAYLRGSMVMGEDPFLGGTTDVDLVFIHSDVPAIPREILRLTDEVHLDIVHHAQKEYLKGRDLRVDPWMGPSLYNAQVLFDPQHFLDFTIATVRGMFYRSDHILMRARPLLDAARQRWIEMQGTSETLEFPISSYLYCIESTANALALLVGEPLTERRMLSEFAQRVEKLDRIGMYAGILGLLGAPKVGVETLKDWVSIWETTFDAISTQDRPAHIHSYRKLYYLHAFKAHLYGEQPKNVLWPLICSWTAIAKLSQNEAPLFTRWVDVLQQLGLCSEDFQERLAGLDAYMDQAEEVIEIWAMENGV